MASSPVSLRVWDIPVRLFHWTLVILLIVLYISGENSEMEIHLYAGLAVLTLVLFRVMWGFVGGEFARFRSFIAGPRAILNYLAHLPSRHPSHALGHNPVGGWSVLLMLFFLTVQGVTGLFANEDVFFTTGPLAGWVEESCSDTLTSLHKLNFNILLALIVLHIGAAMFYLVYKRENLIHPMLSGLKKVPAEIAPKQRDYFGDWRLALGLFILSALVVSSVLLVGD